MDSSAIEGYFDHEGHRTVVSQRALQVHTDPLLGHTTLEGVGFVVSEVSPYEVDLDWGNINEPDDMAAVVDAGPGHRQDPLRLRRGQRPGPGRLPGRGGDRRGAGRPTKEFASYVEDFGVDYAVTVRNDHALFVDAFREGRIGISAT